jgi:HSP20 family protein
MFAVRTFHRSSALPALSQVLDSMMRADAAASPAAETHSPRIEVRETDSAYELRAELPGVAREQIKVAVEARRVSITTHADATHSEAQPTEDTLSTSKLIYSDGLPTRYARTVTLPHPLNADAVAAKLEHGVLTLTLPKLASVQPRQVVIN